MCLECQVYVNRVFQFSYLTEFFTLICINIKKLLKGLKNRKKLPPFFNSFDSLKLSTIYFYVLHSQWLCFNTGKKKIRQKTKIENSIFKNTTLEDRLKSHFINFPLSNLQMADKNNYTKYASLWDPRSLFKLHKYVVRIILSLIPETFGFLNKLSVF